MATSDGVHGEEAGLCAVCLQRYRDPRLLPCLHTLCRVCIDELLVTADDGKIICPLCRSSCSLPAKGGTALPKDFTVALNGANEESSAASKPCAACKRQDLESTNTAIVRCENCELLLCNQHIGPHVVAIATEKHILSTLQGSGRETEVISRQVIRCRASPEPTVPLCPQHGQPLRMYCGTCEVPICGDCTALGEHHGHKPIHYVKDIVEERKAKVEEQAGVLQRDTIKRLERSLRTVDCVCGALERQAEEICGDIQLAGKEAMETVEVHVLQMLQEVKDTKDARLKVLGQQREELKSHLEAAQNAICFSKRIMQESDSGEAFIALLYALEKRMANLISAEIKERPQHHSRFLFQAADDATRSTKAKESIGKALPCEASAEHSVIEGGTSTWAFKGTSAKFKLQAKDGNGQTMTVGGDVIVAKPAQFSDLKIFSIEVEDHSDGSYTIACAPASDLPDKTYQLEIFINGEKMNNDLSVSFCDSQWDQAANRHPQYIEISNDRRKALYKNCPASGYHYSILGSTPMSSGEHTWKVRISSSNQSHHSLGIAPHHNQLTTGYNEFSTKAYCWYTGGGVYYRDNIHYDGEISSWSANDTLQLHLNCDQHTLQITNLRSNQTSTMHNLPQKEYFQFASVYQFGNSVEFVS